MLRRFSSTCSFCVKAYLMIVKTQIVETLRNVAFILNICLQKRLMTAESSGISRIRAPAPSGLTSPIEGKSPHVLKPPFFAVGIMFLDASSSPYYGYALWGLHTGHHSSCPAFRAKVIKKHPLKMYLMHMKLHRAADVLQHLILT